MKIGLILECDRGGTDQQVYEFVAKKICPSAEYLIEPAGTNKPTMIENCGKVAKILIEKLGCTQVAIIWDLMPRWGGTPCRNEDKAQIIKNLASQGVSLNQVKLICIEPELESWIITEAKGLTSYKAQLSHPHKIPPFRSQILQESDNKAKAYISKYLGRRYNDISEAIRIVQHISDFSKFKRKHPSYERFHDFINSNCI